MPCIEADRGPFRPRHPALVLGLSLALAGCTLGPRYQGPPTVGSSASGSQALLRAADAGVHTRTVQSPSQWWLALGDAQLSALIEQGLQHNPSLRAAEARLQASRALLSQRQAEQMPSVGALAGYNYVSPPRAIERGIERAMDGAGYARNGSVDLDTELYTVGFDASWEIDVFGRRSRATEGAVAQAGAQAAQLADAQVQLAAELGQVYLGYRANQARLQVAEDSLDQALRMLELTRQRRARGAATELDVERLELQRRQQEAVLPALHAQLQVALDQLALMTGGEPGALDARLAAVMPLPQLPARIEVGDAGELIQRRPDIRQAERELAAANAQIGEALSGYFPQVKLLGVLGAGADSISGLTSNAATWMIAPMLSWPLLDFGRVRARVDQAKAGHAARLAAYEGTVLAALQDANAALSRFGSARQQWATAEQAQAAAERAGALMLQRQQAGAASVIDLLDVQRQQLSARDQTLQAQTQMLVNYVALQKSLGLGWEAEPNQIAEPATAHP